MQAQGEPQSLSCHAVVQEAAVWKLGSAADSGSNTQVPPSSTNSQPARFTCRGWVNRDQVLGRGTCVSPPLFLSLRCWVSPRWVQHPMQPLPTTPDYSMAGAALGFSPHQGQWGTVAAVAKWYLLPAPAPCMASWCLLLAWGLQLCLYLHPPMVWGAMSCTPL